MQGDDAERWVADLVRSAQENSLSQSLIYAKVDSEEKTMSMRMAPSELFTRSKCAVAGADVSNALSFPSYRLFLLVHSRQVQSLCAPNSNAIRANRGCGV